MCDCIDQEGAADGESVHQNKHPASFFIAKSLSASCICLHTLQGAEHLRTPLLHTFEKMLSVERIKQLRMLELHQTHAGLRTPPCVPLPAASANISPPPLPAAVPLSPPNV